MKFHRKPAHILGLFLSLFFFSEPAQSQEFSDTLYVGNSGSDTFNGQTRSQALKTIGMSFRWAVLTSGRVLVLLDDGIYNSESFPLQAPNNVTLRGENGPEHAIIDAAGTNARVIDVVSVQNVTLENLSIRGGSALGASGKTADGGGLYVAFTGNARFSNLKIYGNAASQNGGGVFVEDDPGTIFENCEIFDNEARLGGGLFFAFNSETEVRDCHLYQNQASYSGGGVYVSAGSPKFYRNRISYNTRTPGTQKGAGGITVENGNPVIGGAEGQGNDVYGNTGGEKGTQLYVESDAVINARYNYWGVEPSSRTISKTEKADFNNFRNLAVNIPFGTHDFYVSPNGDDAHHGASPEQAWRTISYAITQFYSSELDTNTIHLLPGVYTNSPGGETFPIPLKRNLSVVGAAAGVIFDGQTAGDASIFTGFQIERTALKNITFQNMRGSKFGAIFMEDVDDFVTANCVFRNNFSPQGGCITLLNTKDSEIHDNVFEDNWADDGGVIHASDDKADVYRNIFRNNSAKRGGAAFLTTNSSGLFFENEFQANSADSGGAVYLLDAFTEFENNRMTGNAARDVGGAIAMNAASLPELGGRGSKSNDFYDNTAGIRGSQIARIGNGLTVEARHNYWGGVPDSSLLSPFAQFAREPFRTASAFTDPKDRKFYVSLFGDNNNDGLTPQTAWRTISYAAKQFFVADSQKVTLSLASGVYSLSSVGEAFPFRVDDYVILEGAAEGETIFDGENLSRILEIDGGKHFELRRLIFQNGNAGGENGGGARLTNAENAVIENCTFRNNVGKLGGGLALEGAVSGRIQNNVFSENGAVDGGGAFLSGDSLRFVENTLFANQADSGKGGGVFVNFSNSLEIKANEVFENQAKQGGGVALQNSDGSIALNSIVRNVARQGGGVFLESSSRVTVGGDYENGNDIYGNLASGAGTQLFGANSGRVDANGNFWDAAPTDSLVSGSLPVDFSLYRSVTSRAPHDTREFFFAPNGSDLNSGLDSTAPWKILKTGFERVFAEKGDSIVFSLASGVYSASSEQAFPIQIENGVHLLGKTTAEDTTVFDGQRQSRIFEAREASNISLQNLAVRNGFFQAQTENSEAFNGGAGLLADGVDTLTLKSVVFTGNESRGGFGGALAVINDAKNVVVDSVFFEDNFAETGGGFYAENPDEMTIDQSRFWGNGGRGGGFFVRGGSVNLKNSSLIRNSSPGPGSAMFFAGTSTGLIAKNIIIENIVTASDTGAAIAIAAESLPIIGGTAGAGNDIYNNKGGTMARALTRTNSAAPTAGIVDARFNYFVTETVDEALVAPISAFNLENIRTIPIFVNHKPTVLSATPEPGEIQLDAPQEITFSVEAVDLDNDPVTHVWAVNNGGVGTRTSYTLPERKPGSRDHIKLRLTDGKSDVFVEWFVNTGTATSIGDRKTEMPTTFSLAQNYPNPFNPVTTISFALPKKSHVRLAVYSSAGALVETLVEQEMNAGFHRLQWRAVNAASGVYFLHLKTSEFEEKKKMLLIR